MVGHESVLIIDDQPNFTWAMRQTLSQWGYSAQSARTAEEVLDRQWHPRPGCVLLDVRLPGMSGLEALAHLHRRWPDLPVIVVTAFGTVETAVESVRRGAFDYLTKPFGPSELKTAVEKALARRGAVRAEEPGGDALSPAHEPVIVGHCPLMQKMYKLIARAAAGDVSTLISGPTGSGKELVARAIHHHSARSARPLVVLNCACLEGPLLDSELFGHVKGAFTGADSERTGKIEQADGGTLFLDEVADLPIATQAKLLRFLDDGAYYRLGDSSLRRCNARVLAATNQPLEELMTKGRFRPDLYYRLAGLSIQVPPLAQRKEDLDLLVDHFLRRRSAGRSQSLAISPEARGLLHAYPWPGNVRELFQALDHACTLSLDGAVAPEHLPERIAATVSDDLDPGIAQLAERLFDQALRGGNACDAFGRLSAAWETELLRRAYDHFGGSQRQMASALGMHRTTLRGKLRSAGIIS